MDTLNGRYRLLEQLGQGGMALVYKAQDLLLDRVVAVKVLRESWAADADFISRFRQEARAAARLSHPNIVAVYDVGEDGGRHYIVMEHAEGRSLKEELEKGPLSPLRAVDLGIQLCAGLEYAHKQGIVHRDIKPHNVLLTRGQAKIVDFGIARALGVASQTQGGEVLGSPQYLSPEQAMGQEATAASDIYSFGVLLYQAVTGRLPFAADSPVATALKHIHDIPEPPRQVNAGVPASLEAIVLKAMAKEPQQRFASAAQMGQALVECLARSQEDTAALWLATPFPDSTPPPAVSGATRRQPASLPRRRAKRGFSWGPVAAAFAIVTLVAGLTLASPSLVKLFLTPARSNSLSSPTPVPAPTPPPTSVPTAAALALVPGVTGMLPMDARLLIEGQGLVYREDPREDSNDVPEGRVLRQTPPPGRSASQGSAVTVTISLGPAMVRVPAVTELNVVQAESRLKDVGLKASFREAWSATVPAGMVFQQEPAPGALISRGSPVTLTASKGKEKVAVPNVVGLSEDKAQRAIQQAGLRNFLYVNYQGHDVLPDSALVKVCVGCVLSVTPSPGEMVELGTEIRMAVRKD